MTVKCPITLTELEINYRFMSPVAGGFALGNNANNARRMTEIDATSIPMSAPLAPDLGCICEK